MFSTRVLAASVRNANAVITPSVWMIGRVGAPSPRVLVYPISFVTLVTLDAAGSVTHAPLALLPVLVIVYVPLLR
jgi:hypothetical protein